jgi:hypothetical protein
MWGKTSPPYKYKGPRPVEGHHLIDHLLSTILSPNPSFSNPCAFLVCLDGDQGRSEWPCRPWNNPRRAISDGIPPEATLIGFHCAPAYTAQICAPDQSDRSEQRLCEFRILTPARSSFRVCWHVKVSTVGISSFPTAFCKVLHRMGPIITLFYSVLQRLNQKIEVSLWCYRQILMDFELRWSWVDVTPVFPKKNQVHNYMYAKMYFHTYSDI